MSGDPDKPLSLICVDWGTTNLRAYAIASDGTVINQAQSGAGLRSNPADYSDCLATMIGPWLDQESPINILLSGMVGSPTGWQEVPHVVSPAALPQLSWLFVTEGPPVSQKQKGYSLSLLLLTFAA